MASKFIISLDFEKIWGFNDFEQDELLIKRIELVDDVVIRLLHIFKSYNIRVTWAIVSAMLEDYHSVKTHFDSNPLSHCTNRNFDCLIKNERYSKIFFIDYFERLLSDGHEVATHTHTHLYSNNYISNQDIVNDIAYSINIISKLANMKCSSIVFPRNLYDEQLLRDVKKIGITCCRGNNLNVIDKQDANVSKPYKFFRVIDSYLPFFYFYRDLDTIEHNTIKISNATRFFRITQSSLLNKIHLSNILHHMTFCAKNNKDFHLWWHPHNFLSNVDSAFFCLEKVLSHYHALAKTYDFQNSTMNGL